MLIKLVEQREPVALAELEFDTAPTAPEITRAFWRRLSAPDLVANERLFFEICGQALHGRPGTTPLLDGIVDSWVTPVVELLYRLGFPQNTPPHRARPSIAVTRGLLLDLSATRDRLACDAAMGQYSRLGEACLADRSSPPPR